jgi:hypothetical protein
MLSIIKDFVLNVEVSNPFDNVPARINPVNERLPIAKANAFQ